jgi:hypothetical protein
MDDVGDDDDESDSTVDFVSDTRIVDGFKSNGMRI